MAALFLPYRALGIITDAVPFAVQRRGAEAFATVAVGAAWQTFNCARLLLVAASPQLPGPVGALAASDDLTFAAVGPDVHVFRRVHRVAVWSGHYSGRVLALLALGPVLLSLGDDGRLLAWAVQQAPARPDEGDAGGPREPQLRQQPLRALGPTPGFTPTCLCHPDAYLNKVGCLNKEYMA